MLSTSASIRLSPLMLAAAIVATGCGGADTMPPVASVQVTVDQTEVPIGAPVAFTYRFVPGTRIDGDYTVFAHLLNADGHMMWNDDHVPAVPTSAWQPGEAVEYTREAFLTSSQLQPGPAVLEVGLYREGARLPLDGPRPGREAGLRAYPVVDLDLGAETEGVFLVFQSGWHPDEFSNDPASPSWKWTERVASIVFRHPRQDGVLLLEYDGRPELFGDSPQQLRVLGPAAEPIAAFPVDASSRVLRRIPITREQMGEAETVELQLEVDRTFVPAEHGMNAGDDRELGIRVFNVYLDVR
jgi:hypothetical protein